MLVIQGPWEVMPGTEVLANLRIRNWGGSTEGKSLWFVLAPVDENGSFAVGQDVVFEMPVEVYEAFAGTQEGVALSTIKALPPSTYNGKKVDLSKGEILEIEVKTKEERS